MSVHFLVGDVREQLRLLPANSFDCVVTSPPYWGLRDYGVAGQIGLEPTLGEHLAVMVDVFREVRRVLKQHGTLWLNYGDCYATAPNGRAAADVVGDDRTFRDKPFSTIGPIGLSTAQRVTAGKKRNNVDVGGWGASDRSTRWRGGGFLKPKDLCMIPNRLAIALQDDGWWVRSEIIWHKPNPMPESVYDRPTSAHEKVWLLTKGEDYFYDHEAIREPVTGGAHRRAVGPNSREARDRVPASRKGPKDVGRDEIGLKVSDRFGRGAGWRLGGKTVEPGLGVRNNSSFHDGRAELVETRNARNVWTIAPKAFREAHFATFPPALAERCIKAGTPALVCRLCGRAEACGGLCDLSAPGRVLDPFGGAGTVGLVADQLGRDATLIELNPEYAAMAERRVRGEPAPILEAAE